MKHTVAAARSLTGDETAVAVDPVSVVTFFARIDTAVATRRALTSRIATVIVDLVTVIAFFKSRFAFLRVQTADTVTTKRCATAV
jgi:hypothetical protein